MIERLDHVALLVKDARQTAQFYCDWAGMSVIHDRQDEGSDHRVCWVRLGQDRSGLIIVLVESDRQPPVGRMDHFGFHVGSRKDVDEIAERARPLGILVEEPQDAGPVVGYYCMIRDPEGNYLEFSCEQLEA